MDIKEEILAQMDSALRPEFDKAIDNTIEGAFKEDVKTLGFMVANSIKCQWEVMKPHLFYAYCLGVKAQEAKAQAVPEGFVVVPREPYAYLIKHKLWKKDSDPEIFLAVDFLGDDGVEKDKLVVCKPLYLGDDEAQEQVG